VPVAIIGQAFPYTPIANPRYMVADWSFGIQDDNLQKMVDEARGKGAQVVVVLSHNGMDVDLKMASRVRGIDAIFGGHTHDGVPVAGAGEERRRHHAGHQRRQQRQVPGRDGLRRQGRQGGRLPLPLLPVFANQLQGRRRRWTR
jgi:sulfur-oxidizing protein SoxB